MSSFKEKFLTTRTQTETICSHLATEDFSVQPAVFVSPPKWHLAHTTWFFEQFVLVKFDLEYKIYNDDFAYLFNSYYNNAGERVLRPNRGLMTRPTVKEVMDYRAYVTKNVVQLLEKDTNKELLEIVEIGINHEQQHQELLAYDIKYILGNQPTFPVIKNNFNLEEEIQQQQFITIEEGVYNIGHLGNDFCFDNELGAHKVYIQPFQISNKLVTNKEYIEFIEAGGYNNFNLWHADGWDFIQNNNIEAPLYWHKVKGVWHYYTYNGFTPVEANKPVNHISFFEAYAFAEWKNMRLSTEFEWEVASKHFNWGQLWEWTNSAYLPYPNFTKAPGALGEYNGKFMVNQHVLRGA
ncbi:MAG: ergothioneine biosynthesis protein EgtB, partial [Gelidibacter sp.]|nr:ergothioneine biosynthesis protein EgtB [Gelidibacter sp.]